jgi:hypothetical protein
LPLVEEPLLVDPLALDAPDAPVDELDDEHAAVTPSSNAAVAPAAGTDKDRFIPAPSREFRALPPAPGMAQGTPHKRAEPGLLHPANRHVQLLATSRKHMG